MPHYRKSYIALTGRGESSHENNTEIHIYPKSYALKDFSDPFSHLEFAIKYDGLNLEIIQAFFNAISAEDVRHYILQKQTSVYKRKVWYLYEMFTGTKLVIDDLTQGNYTNLLDSKHYYTCKPVASRRHRVNDNLLGNAAFCPIVRKTASLNKFEQIDTNKLIQNLIASYDERLITRAVNYLYAKETMSSYQIEREQPNQKKLTQLIKLLKEVHHNTNITK